MNFAANQQSMQQGSVALAADAYRPNATAVARQLMMLEAEAKDLGLPLAASLIGAACLEVNQRIMDEMMQDNLTSACAD